MKVVVNKCFGGFSISRECAEYMEKLGCKQANLELEDWRKRLGWFNHKKKTGQYPKEMPKGDYSIMDIDIKYNSEPKFYGYGHGDDFNGYARDSKYLVEAIEKLGDKANGGHAELQVVEIPDDVKWHIDEYDGLEHVAEDHRTW